MQNKIKLYLCVLNHRIMSPIKVEVGKPVWLRAINNAARRANGSRIETAIVTKVGNKYFQLDKEFFGKFNLTDGRQQSNSSPDWIAYETEQHLMDDISADTLRKELRMFFTYSTHKLTLKQLSEINNIINPKPHAG